MTRITIIFVTILVLIIISQVFTNTSLSSIPRPTIDRTVLAATLTPTVIILTPISPVSRVNYNYYFPIIYK